MDNKEQLLKVLVGRQLALDEDDGDEDGESGELELKLLDDLKMDESFKETLLTLLNMAAEDGELGLDVTKLVFKVMLLVKDEEESSMDMVDTSESPPPPPLRIIDRLTKLLNPSTCLSRSDIFHNFIVLSLVDNKK